MAGRLCTGVRPFLVLYHINYGRSECLNGNIKQRYPQTKPLALKLLMKKKDKLRFLLVTVLWGHFSKFDFLPS